MLSVDKPRFLSQLNFFDQIPLTQELPDSPPSIGIDDFFRNHGLPAIDLIGQVFVPDFPESFTGELQTCLAHKIFPKKFSLPPYIGHYKNSLAYIFMAQAELFDDPRLNKDARQLPITYPSTDKNFKRGIIAVLLPWYQNLRINSIELQAKQYGHDHKIDPEKLTSLAFLRTNQMFMTNGDWYKEEGMDILVGYFFFTYCLYLKQLVFSHLGNKSAP